MVDADTLKIILSWMTIPFFVTGFIGNVLVIRIVHKTRDMHTPTNYLLASMAVSDAVAILLCSMYWFGTGRFVCKVTVFFEIVVAVSSITLIVLAVERYHALMKPFRTGLRLTEDNIKKAIALVWSISVVVSFPAFILTKWSETYSTCIGPWTLHKTPTTKPYVIVSATFVFIDLAILCCCYGSLIRGLYFTNTVCPETTEERSPEKKKLVITFLLATIGFFIGYAPFVAFYTVVALGDDKLVDSELYRTLSLVVDFVLTCSLCFNPILYAFRSTNFQEGFKRMLRGEPVTSPNEIE